MKYMIMMFGDAASMTEVRSPEWITEMIAFMMGLNRDLESSGELVTAVGLADGSTAKRVSLEKGVPVTTDGPFAESKESVIGFWIVDVDSEERALAISGQIVEWSGMVEVRRVGDAPPEQ